MSETYAASIHKKASHGSTMPRTDDDRVIMAKIREVIKRGHNAEVKKNSDGTLAVMEVKKNIV